MKKFLAIFLLIIFFSFNFFSFASAEVAQIPNTIDEAKQMGEGMLPLIPGAIKTVFTEGFSITKNIFGVIANIWNQYIYPQIDKYFGSIIKERGPVIKSEFDKESQEMQADIKAEAPKIGSTIWNKLKEFFLKNQD